MSDRDSSRAQQDALRGARAANAGDRSRAHEDALARYLRLNARRPARRQSKQPEPPATDTESE
jgi:hypothetical protein